MVAFRDADNQSLLQYVKARLHDVGIDVRFSLEEMVLIDRLGSTASNLTTVCLDSARFTVWR